MKLATKDTSSWRASSADARLMCAEQTNFPHCSTTMQHLGQEIDVVWFKRDLRIRDHAPLVQALRDGRRVLLLHTYEPARTSHTPRPATRHLTFRWQAWTSLCAEVSALLGSAGGNGCSVGACVGGIPVPT